MRILFAVMASASVALGVTVSTSGASAAEGVSGVGFALENGDINGDLSRDVSDVISLLGNLFAGKSEPVPLATCNGEGPFVRNGDSNGDGALDVSDAVHLLTWLYRGGPAPADGCGRGDGGIASANENPRIIPVHASPFGKTYGEWVAGWWQWALGLPATGHPLIDGDCATGQSGKVFYLGGSFSTAEAERDCVIPAGTAIFFPILNAECSSIEPEPYSCSDESSCLACNDAIFSPADVLSLTIDGREAKNLLGYRVRSGLFDIGPFPADAVFGIPEGASGVSLGDGYYVMLAPLSRGEHVIRFTGCFDVFGGCEGFELKIQYNITVE